MPVKMLDKKENSVSIKNEEVFNYLNKGYKVITDDGDYNLDELLKEFKYNFGDLDFDDYFDMFYGSKTGHHLSVFIDEHKEVIKEVLNKYVSDEMDYARDDDKIMLKIVKWFIE